MESRARVVRGRTSNRFQDVLRRLQSNLDDAWSKELYNELNRLSSTLSTTLPIYSTLFTRSQLLASIRLIQECNSNAPLPFDTDLHHGGLTNYLLFISLHTHKLVSEILLARVHHLKKHLDYWQHDDERRRNQIAFIEQIKTTFWFDRDRDDIRSLDKVKILSTHEHNLASTIGRLVYAIADLHHQLERFDLPSSSTTSLEPLDSIMKHTNELYALLFDDALVDYNAHSDLTDVIELYAQMLAALDDFETRWLEKVHLYYRPTHFKRYLTHYICFSAISLYGFYKIYSNQDHIIAYFYSSYDSFKIFLNEHLIIPLETIYTSTFESKTSQAVYENVQKNFTSSKKILEEMIEEYGRKHAQTLAEIEHISVEEFLSTLSQRALNEDMNVVMKNYQQELTTPIRSALFGDLLTGILIQVQNAKVNGETLAIQVDQLMKQNQINFSLLATIPAVLLFTLVTIVTKNIITNRLIKRRKFDLSTIRQQIIRKLRQIEQLLIFNIESSALISNNDDEQELIAVERHSIRTGSGDHRIMNTSTFGQFLCLIYELKYFTNQLKSKRMLSKEFNDDISLLTNTHLSTKQKLLIIQQVFHSYSFLVHTN